MVRWSLAALRSGVAESEGGDEDSREQGGGGPEQGGGGAELSRHGPLDYPLMLIALIQASFGFHDLLIYKQAASPPGVRLYWLIALLKKTAQARF